ncbi:E3 ubiquitin ligase BIG BROTHER-related-like [Gossypium arboreum]|uniref:RING-type domain-containing protein n=1 Tax=Gossypium arboreum TaxID=29729 RepID=A0ABR0PZ35_GOSAR|nr:E3 ubiquitin ligase BIG BROTHER-related-like [Gossypium arboreum]KAK5832227.1 hypothetical protein PVK06_016027 [Gossypium arboreum]
MENEGAKQSSKMLPFTQLDLIDSDLAVALALQEQERVFSLLETVERDGYDNDVDDDSDVFHDQNNTTSYEYIEDGGNLEFLNRQNSNDSEDDYDNDDDDDNDDFEHDIDLDDFSYEELIALGELIGIERRGLSENEISSCLVPVKFQSIEHENEIDRCVICQVEYGENEEGLVALPNCKHPYHLDCISKWLQMKKLCPICSTEISSSIHQC